MYYRQFFCAGFVNSFVTVRKCNKQSTFDVLRNSTFYKNVESTLSSPQPPKSPLPLRHHHITPITMHIMTKNLRCYRAIATAVFTEVRCSCRILHLPAATNNKLWCRRNIARFLGGETLHSQRDGWWLCMPEVSMWNSRVIPIILNTISRRNLHSTWRWVWTWCIRNINRSAPRGGGRGAPLWSVHRLHTDGCYWNKELRRFELVLYICWYGNEGVDHTVPSGTIVR